MRGFQILSDLRKLSKNVRVICVAELLNDVGASIHSPALPVLYNMLGATPFQYGVIEGFSSFFGMVGAAPAGELSDRVGRRRLYYIGHALMGLLRLSWGLISSFWLLLPLRLLYRLGMAVRYAVRDPLLAESSTPETRGLAYSAYELADCVGSFLGPFLPILVLSYIGQNIDAIRRLFFIAAIPNLLSTLLIAVLIVDTVRLRGPQKEKMSVSIKLRLLSGNRNLLYFMIMTSFSAILAMTVDLELLYITYGPIEASALFATLMYLSWTAATVFAALPAGRIVDNRGRRFAIVLAFTFHSISMTIIILHHFVLSNIFLIPLAFASLGLYDSFLSVSSRTFVADNASIENRGMVMGVYTTSEGICKRSLAPIIAGFLFSTHSYISPFIIGLSASLTTAVLLMKIISEPPIAPAG